MFYSFLMPINLIKHAAETSNFSMSRMSCIKTVFVCSGRNCFMLTVFHSTRTCPIRDKFFTCTAFAILFHNIMSLIGMFTCTFKVLRPINWKINVIQTLAFCCFTFNFCTSLSKVIMSLIEMITKTFGSQSNILAFFPILIDPNCVKSILR